jgi:hypothetical protein
MALSESELEMVARHVAEGERHVSLQEQIVSHLGEIGASTDMAEELLVEFRSTLGRHRAHLLRLSDESGR